jgi:hypothetical protein
VPCVLYILHSLSVLRNISLWLTVVLQFKPYWSIYIYIHTYTRYYFILFYLETYLLCIFFLELLKLLRNMPLFARGALANASVSFRSSFDSLCCWYVHTNKERYKFLEVCLSCEVSDAKFLLFGSTDRARKRAQRLSKFLFYSVPVGKEGYRMLWLARRLAGSLYMGAS